MRVIVCNHGFRMCERGGGESERGRGGCIFTRKASLLGKLAEQLYLCLQLFRFTLVLLSSESLFERDQGL